MRKYRTWHNLLLFVLMLAVFATGIAVGRRYARNEAQPVDGASGRSGDSLRLVWEALDQVERKFYSESPVEVQELSYGAVRGLVSSLGDPNTVFVEPQQRRLESDTLRGEFGGIGVRMAVAESEIKIADVLADSPAERVGLQIGDTLRLVDGQGVAGLGLDQAVLLIRGPIGSRVRVDMERQGTLLSFEIVRGRIELPSLSWHLMPGAIGYIYIHLFSGRTGDELLRAIGYLQEHDVQAIVLDLRGNGGGVVEGATDVLSVLVGHGIAFRELRTGGNERRHPIPFSSSPTDLPLAVLVDGRTASAAELVAAAIRDYNRGVLIGETTFGKGSIQGIFELVDGSSVHLTVAHWLSSNGQPIEGLGLEPDIAVRSSDSDEEDLALRLAVEHLQNEPGSAVTLDYGAVMSFHMGKGSYG